MNIVKASIQQRLESLTDLVRLCGSAAAISRAWPAEDAAYAPCPPGTDLAALTLLPAGAAPRARVVHFMLSPTRGLYVRRLHDDVFQIDIFSSSEQLNDAIALLIENSFDEKPWPDTAGLDIKETYCTPGPDLYESDTALHHKVMTLRLVWMPTA